MHAGRPRLLKLSLRYKLPAAAGACVVIALSAHLLIAGSLTRSYLLREETEILRSVGELYCSQIQGSGGAAQATLECFVERQPSIELIYIDSESTVLAASRPDIVGQRWHEEGIERILRGEIDFHWAKMEHHGEPVIDITIPCRPEAGAPLHAVHVAQSMPQVQEHVGALQLRLTLFAVGAALIVGLLLSLSTYFFVIRRLSRLGRELDLSHPVIDAAKGGTESHDEIDRLARGLHELVGGLTETQRELEETLAEKDRLLLRVERFNDELEAEVARVRGELLEAQQGLLRAEHLSTVGQLAAGLAHELRNPLFIIRATAETGTRRGRLSKDVAQDIIEEVDRVDRILARLLDLGSPLDLELCPINLAAVVSEAVTKVEKSLVEPASIELDAPSEAMILADESFLRQALIAVLTNACQAVEGVDSGRVSVALRDLGSSFEVVVRDNGVGMSAEDLRKVFRPFFTRKAGGMGLGLCTAKKIFDLHGATVEIESELSQGTTIAVTFSSIAEAEEAP